MTTRETELREQQAAVMPTPDSILEHQIMSSTVPKNEREHWAAREIERLREALLASPEPEGGAEVLPDCMMPDGADPCIGYQQLRASLSAAEAENAKLKEQNNQYREEIFEAAKRVVTVESELATLKAAGTRAEGIEAAAKAIEAYRQDEPETVASAGLRFQLASIVRALSPKAGAKAAPKAWCLAAAHREADSEVGAGRIASDPTAAPDKDVVGEIVQYRCPVCGIADENAYLRCFRPNCTDGRDPRPQRRFGGKEG